jgi:ferredoxin-NADP reductase
MLLTLPILDVQAATPRARIVRVGLQGHHFPYVPGQAALIGPHGHDRRRPYSIAGSPENAATVGALEFLIGVDPHSGTAGHLALVPGAMVDLEGPIGRFTFPIDPGTNHFLFIAGGTGIAPLRAMIHHALSLPSSRIGVAYSARTCEDFAYLEELRSLERTERIALRLTATREGAGSRWCGHTGRLTATDVAPMLHPSRTLCFVCGPQSLVKEMPALLQAQGVPREWVRIEEWG